MSRHLARDLIADRAIVRESIGKAPPVDRSFNLPPGLYAATGALYFGFIGVMALGFGNPGLVVPLGICAVFLAAFFAVPVIFARVDRGARPMAYDRFRREGVATLTGRLSSGEAAAQMMVLPVLIFGWAIATVTIAALV